MISTAIGEKVGSFQQTFSTFIAGLVIGFYYGWRLTLVMLGCVPLLAVAGGFSTKLMASRNAKEAAMYAEASAISHETFSAMRTVAAFGGEERARRSFAAAIADCMRLGIQQKTISGFGLGLSAPLFLRAARLAPACPLLPSPALTAVLSAAADSPLTCVPTRAQRLLS